jgi:hypothetical protein
MGVRDLLVHRLEQIIERRAVLRPDADLSRHADTNCRSPGMEMFSERHDPPS